MKIVKQEQSTKSQRQIALDSTYQCELSGRELFTLMVIFDGIGGSPSNSLRMYADSMLNSISESEIGELFEPSFSSFIEEDRGCEIHFNNESLDLMENGE